MIKSLLRRINFFRKNNAKSATAMNTKQSKSGQLSKSLNVNLKKLKEIFGTSNDVIIREFNIGFNNESSAAVIFIDGLVEKK